MKNNECDGYEWRHDQIPWKCRLPPGHKTKEGVFLGRSCKGNLTLLEEAEKAKIEELKMNQK